MGSFIGCMVGGCVAASGAPAPSISYAGTPFSWTQYVAIATASVTSSGGPVTSYAVQTGNLPTGISLNTSTGAITGTPTADDGSASVVIRATGAGGTSDATIDVTVFVPTDIVSIGGWWDFSDATTLFTDAGTTAVTADGDAIYQANDKSGAGKHVVQATAINRPTYKTAIKNSRSVGRWVATNVLSVASFDRAASFTLFIVVNSTTGYAYTHDSVGDKSYIYLPGGAHTAIVGGGLGSIFDVTVSLTGAWKILSDRIDGTHAGHVLRNNGTDLTRGTVYGSTNPGAQNAKVFAIGGNANATTGLTGDVAEVIYYAALLSGTEIAQVEAYLAAKWGI